MVFISWLNVLCLPVVVGFLSVMVLSSTPIRAQEDKASQLEKQEKRIADNPQQDQNRLGDFEISAERRSEVFSFVEVNQPQLYKLMSLLEKNRPAQFRRAFGSLTREVDRLLNTKNRSPERYEIALEIWKNQKAMEMLAAQIAIRGENPRAKGQLEELVEQRRNLQIKNIDMDLLVAQQRLERFQKAKADLLAADKLDMDKRVEQIIARAQKLKGDRHESLDVNRETNLKSDK